MRLESETKRIQLWDIYEFVNSIDTEQEQAHKPQIKNTEVFKGCSNYTWLSGLSPLLFQSRVILSGKVAQKENNLRTITSHEDNRQIPFHLTMININKAYIPVSNKI